MAATRAFFRPGAQGNSGPYPLSRTKLQLFLDCPRCFHLDRRTGVVRPDSAFYSLNLAVDALLKREFDFWRLRGEPHPVMQLFGIDAVPLRHRDLALWRDTPTGVRSVHPQSGFEVFGIVDDLWQHEDGSIVVVDYKATSTSGPITLDDRDGYKRQMEVYQWLLRRQGLIVSDTAYFLFANANRERESFDRRLDFTLSILPYVGSDNWVEDALIAAKECLMTDNPPASSADCAWCAYRRKAGEETDKLHIV